MMNKITNDMTLGEWKDIVVVEALKELLYEAYADPLMSTDEDLADAARTLIEYFGTPYEDFTYD